MLWGQNNKIGYIFTRQSISFRPSPINTIFEMALSPYLQRRWPFVPVRSSLVGSNSSTHFKNEQSRINRTNWSWSNATRIQPAQRQQVDKDERWRCSRNWFNSYKKSSTKHSRLSFRTRPSFVSFLPICHNNEHISLVIWVLMCSVQQQQQVFSLRIRIFWIQWSPNWFMIKQRVRFAGHLQSHQCYVRVWKCSFIKSGITEPYSTNLVPFA